MTCRKMILGWCKSIAKKKMLAEQIDKLLHAPGDRPTAIFGANDLMTMSIVRVLVQKRNTGAAGHCCDRF